MKSKSDLEAYVIMYVVKNKKGDVLYLLLKNGVVVPSNANDMQVALVITEMLKTSKSFLKDFTKLVQSKDVVDGITSNMSGSYSYMGGAYSNYNGFEYDKSFDPTDPLFKSLPSKLSSTPAKTSTTTSSSDKISGFEKYLLLGQGLFSDYTKMKENEAKVKLANASVEMEKLKSENGTGGTKDNEFNATPIYVVLGLIGLGLLGFLTYKMTKK